MKLKSPDPVIIPTAKKPITKTKAAIMSVIMFELIALIPTMRAAALGHYQPLSLSLGERLVSAISSRSNNVKFSQIGGGKRSLSYH